MKDDNAVRNILLKQFAPETFAQEQLEADIRHKEHMAFIKGFKTALAEVEEKEKELQQLEKKLIQKQAELQQIEKSLSKDASVKDVLVKHADTVHPAKLFKSKPTKVGIISK
jgi:t-SNARE complex subunit (syntaxin)